MVIDTYAKVFNGRTKAIQVINMLIMGIWVINLLLMYSDAHDMTEPLTQVHTSLLVLNITAFGAGLLGYLCKGQRAYGFKSASLLLAGVFHAITASTYVLNYPPLRVGLLQELMFAVVFFLSGVYTLTNEERYANSRANAG